MPMIYGKDRNKGVRLNGFTPEAVELGDGLKEGDLLIHDATSTQLAYLLASMEYPQYPAPMGGCDSHRAADLWTVTERDDVQPERAGELSLELDEEYVDDIDFRIDPGNYSRTGSVN